MRLGEMKQRFIEAAKRDHLPLATWLKWLAERRIAEQKESEK